VQDTWAITGAGTALDRDREATALDALAARAADGDQAAFEQIYTHMVDELHLYIRGQCRDPAFAEDILSNVFLAAWRSARTYRQGSRQFRRWLFGIARNEVREYWRRRETAIPMLDVDLFDHAEDGLAPPDHVVETIDRAMAQLNEEQRQVVALRYFGNKTHEEIAALLGKREGAVRAQLMRALRQMRKVIVDAPA
jgi:RNA polymerase sigma-70 factor (ECF subfamily)